MNSHVSLTQQHNPQQNQAHTSFLTTLNGKTKHPKDPTNQKTSLPSKKEWNQHQEHQSHQLQSTKPNKAAIFQLKEIFQIKSRWSIILL